MARSIIPSGKGTILLEESYETRANAAFNEDEEDLPPASQHCGGAATTTS